MNQANNSLPVSIVIPTFGRNQVLIDTINSLLALESTASELIIVDQSLTHDPLTAESLAKWQGDNTIKLIQLDRPSIPHAMNTGLLHASNRLVLFLDDDINAHQKLVSSHYIAHQQNPNSIIAGKVIQPWDEQEKLNDYGHQFNSEEKKYINHFMGGNFSINKHEALKLGGFDENFVGVAYRFEKEFADRWLESGEKILFIPQAVIDHLKVVTGGTRVYGEHLTTLKPHHAVGAYYYLLISTRVEDKLSQMFRRLFQSITTRHHLRRPWYIPVTLIAEIRGILKAIKLSKSGPQTIQASSETS